jgi:hypothetical protein
MSWAAFVRSHAHLIAAAGFFVTEAWTVRGLVRHFTLCFVDIATRRVSDPESDIRVDGADGPKRDRL